MTLVNQVGAAAMPGKFPGATSPQHLLEPAVIVDIDKYSRSSQKSVARDLIRHAWRPDDKRRIQLRTRLPRSGAWRTQKMKPARQEKTRLLPPATNIIHPSE